MVDSSQHLKNLYPFLHGDKKDSAQENLMLLDSVHQKVEHSLSVKKAFFDDNAQSLVDAAKAMAQIYLNKGRMLCMGNGRNRASEKSLSFPAR